MYNIFIYKDLRRAFSQAIIINVSNTYLMTTTVMRDKYALCHLAGAMQRFQYYTAHCSADNSIRATQFMSCRFAMIAHFFSFAIFNRKTGAASTGFL